ncbi:MAG: outer membrane lipoprotein chaperone LolA [Gemmatimonadaceae bacterium]|nr:outer membrane lipoprotein chaperone LolA [Gemmatimonadaceae bacterium]
MITFSLRTATFAVAAAALALATPGSAAGAQAPTAAVDRAVAAWAKVTTVRATFEQSVTNPLTGGREQARGEYQQRGRDRISINFSDPKGDRIVADGQSLWLYLPSTTPGQVIRTSPAAGSVDFTAQFLASPKTRYTIADAGRGTVDGRAAQAVMLTPRAKDVPFTRAKVWIDDRDGLIRQFEVVERSGVTRMVRLVGMRINVPVDDAAFKFVAPKGVRVVQQ